MWPAYVDFNDEDCKKVLRTLELDAYSSIINAFRAQGTLTKDRKRILEELCQALGISTERHRAEIRRAVNDEHLNTIAERLFGPNTITGWTTEGRRLIPIMSRLGPQTVFTEIANSVATAQAEKNTLLQYPGKTGRIEMINGIETMACRKRKECLPECSYASPPPPKIPAVEHFNNVLITECTDITCLTPSTSENCLSAEGTKTSSSAPDFNFPRSTVPLLTSTPNPSPLKSTSKHPMMKVPSTVTTFSSFEQMTSNLMASRDCALNSASSAVLDEVTIISEAGKSVDLKNAPRPLTSIGSMKSSTIVIPTSTSSICSTSKECMLTTPVSSQNNKFVTQIRAKTPTNTRPNLPAGLGIKMSPQQSPIRHTLPPKSPSMKLKHDSSSIFAKKTPPNVFSDHQAPQFSSSSSSSSSSLDIITPAKTPHPSKLNSKSDTPTILSHQPSAKQNTLTKSLPKTTGGSQYLSRSLFSTAKPGPKNLPPVIFNVSSSSSCSPVQTTTKTTGTLQVETKSNSQLLPKTTSVNVTSNQLKISTSNSQQTIQYRNDGGLVRSARIVNITQPVGSRLPCAITPSAISALGLTTGISPTALRVTLPAGTLNSSSAIRVSTAAKPNVIVVHKAQVWPRQGSQQSAVIMSSTPLPKLTNDSSENPSLKSEKTKPILKSTPTRPTASGLRPQSPIVTSSLVKTSENSSLSNPTTSGPSVEISNSKYSESMTDAQCKMNLLADVIEASGILLDSNSPEKSGKGHCNKNNFSDVPNHQEAGISLKTSSSSIEETFKLSESNACNSDPMTSASAESSKSVTKIDKNGVEIKLPLSQFKSVEIQRKESSNTINSSLASGSIVSSSECESKVLKEADKSS